jgi:ATP-dependent Clp protease protease subunit
VELSNTPRAATTGGGLDDQVYQRLLKERIIFLGSVVEDSMANAIPCLTSTTKHLMRSP